MEKLKLTNWSDKQATATQNTLAQLENEKASEVARFAQIAENTNSNLAIEVYFSFNPEIYQP